MGLLQKLRRPPRPAIAGIRSDGFRVGLSLGFHPDLVQAAREQGGVWHAASRSWVLPLSEDLPALLDAFGAKRGDRLAYDAAQSRELLAAAIAHPDPDAFVPDLDVGLYPVADEGGYVVDARYDALLVNCLRALGGRFLRSKQGWYVQRPLDALLDALRASAGVERAHLYLHEGEIRLDRSGGGIDAEPRPTINVSGVAPKGAPEGDGEEGEDARLSIVLKPLERLPMDRAAFEAAIADMSLLAHQPAGIWHLLSANSALLADAPGLGKSRQAAVAGQLIAGAGCAVMVCPANLTINWEREIHAADPAAKVAILDRHGIEAEPDWLVASYERLGDVVQLLADGKIHPRACFFDEAHGLVNPQAARTLNAFLLAQKVPRRYPLTATPVLNRVVELHTLLRLSGHPLGDMERGEFAKEFGGSSEARRVLAERIREWMLARPKSVLGLKPKLQDPQYLALPELEAARYRAIANDPSLTALAKIGHLRQLLERAKADWLIASIKAGAPDDKALVFCEFQDTVEYLADEFEKAGIRVVTYLGKYGKTRKQRAIDTFQADPGVRVFIGTTKAAGVGHTLTAANVCYFASLPWTAALKRQAEDRAWRHGQLREVMVMIPLFIGTIDEQAMALILHKEQIERDVMEDPAAAVLQLELDADPIDADDISVDDPEYSAMLQLAAAA